jgi:hypothetical protein
VRERLGIDEQRDIDEGHQYRHGQVFRFAGHFFKNSILTGAYIEVLHNLDRLKLGGLE